MPESLASIELRGGRSFGVGAGHVKREAEDSVGERVVAPCPNRSHEPAQTCVSLGPWCRGTREYRSVRVRPREVTKRSDGILPRLLHPTVVRGVLGAL
jgi:hypothetical protein